MEIYARINNVAAIFKTQQKQKPLDFKVLCLSIN